MIETLTGEENEVGTSTISGNIWDGMTYVNNQVPTDGPSSVWSLPSTDIHRLSDLTSNLIDNHEIQGMEDFFPPLSYFDYKFSTSLLPPERYRTRDQINKDSGDEKSVCFSSPESWRPTSWERS